MARRRDFRVGGLLIIHIESVEDYVDFPDPLEHLIGFISYKRPPAPPEELPKTSQRAPRSAREEHKRPLVTNDVPPVPYGQNTGSKETTNVKRVAK